MKIIKNIFKKIKIISRNRRYENMYNIILK